MINKISTKISKSLVQNEIINFDDYEVCVYGLESIMCTFFQVLGLMILGYLLGCLPQIIIFFIFFSSLRTSAGGWHAPNYAACCTCIVISSFGSIFTINNIRVFRDIRVIALFLVASLILVLKYAPVDNPNKRLSAGEKARHRRNSKIVFFIQLLVILTAYFIDNSLVDYCATAAAANFLEAVTLIN
jgi:accessory gene regulator B